MSSPADLRYTASHEWVRVEGDVATIGITHFAQQSLGDVVFVDMPEVGTSFDKGDQAADIESVKAVSSIYAAVGGEIVEVNDSVDESPETVNQDPYGEGWLFRVRMSDPDELASLLTAEAYDASLVGQG